MNELMAPQPRTLEALLGSQNIRKRFDDILGKKAAGFVSSIISAVNQNPALKQADPMTVVSAAAVAASLDLPINPNLGFAHIVPYDGRAQFQMGWRGYVQLGQRSGQYRTINVSVVHEGELKKYDKFTGEMEFDEKGKTSDKVIGYVAYFRLLNGFEKYFYMSLEEVQAHGKRYSKSYNNPRAMWQKDFDAMALKTVIKLLLNRWGILSIDMQQAIQVDQAVVKDEGIYEYVDNPESDVPPDTSAFDELIDQIKIDENDREMLNKYLGLIAKTQRATIDHVKVEAAKDFQRFWGGSPEKKERGFLGWLKDNRPEEEVRSSPGENKNHRSKSASANQSNGLFEDKRSEFITCPQDGSKKKKEDCDSKCNMREGCPKWE